MRIPSHPLLSSRPYIRVHSFPGLILYRKCCRSRICLVPLAQHSYSALVQQSVQAPAAHVDGSFPLEYVCDMIPRMANIYQETGKLTVEQRFAREFPGLTFKHGTFYDARKVWDEVPKHVATEFSDAGRQPAGRWSLMTQWWRENVDNKRSEEAKRAKRARRRKE